MWYFYVEGSTTIPSSYTFRVGQVPLDKLPSLALLRIFLFDYRIQGRGLFSRSLFVFH